MSATQADGMMYKNVITPVSNPGLMSRMSSQMLSAAAICDSTQFIDRSFVCACNLSSC